MNEIIEPQSIPEPILKRRESITLFQVAVIALAAIGLLAVIGGILLSFFDRSIPESVIVLGSVAVGALAGMVAPSAVRE
jgi:uncharacterized membrane protein